MKSILFTGVLAAMTLSAPNAFAIPSCEATVIPLALEMAKANRQGDLTRKLYIDVSADYTEIVVTLARQDVSREARFKMTMSDFASCTVSKVEALAQ